MQLDSGVSPQNSGEAQCSWQACDGEGVQATRDESSGSFTCCHHYCTVCTARVAVLQEDCMHFGAHQALLQCQLGRLCRAQRLLPKMIEISYACTTDLTTQSATRLEKRSAFPAGAPTAFCQHLSRCKSDQPLHSALVNAQIQHSNSQSK